MPWRLLSRLKSNNVQAVRLALQSVALTGALISRCSSGRFLAGKMATCVTVVCHFQTVTNNTRSYQSSAKADADDLLEKCWRGVLECLLSKLSCDHFYPYQISIALAHATAA
jgi:hypothetical protein